MAGPGANITKTNLHPTGSAGDGIDPSLEWKGSNETWKSYPWRGGNDLERTLEGETLETYIHVYVYMYIDIFIWN